MNSVLNSKLSWNEVWLKSEDFKCYSYLDSRFEALIRQSLPNDNSTFKLIGFIDKIISPFFSSWGFYSYVYATKKEKEVML